MHTSLPLRNDLIYMKDGHFAETNEKWIFPVLRFLFFGLWSIVLIFYVTFFYHNIFLHLYQWKLIYDRHLLYFLDYSSLNKFTSVNGLFTGEIV